MTLPNTALDVELLKKVIRIAKYGDVPFGVVDYSIQSGRNIQSIKLKGSITSTAVSGANSGRAAASAQLALQLAIDKELEGLDTASRAKRVEALLGIQEGGLFKPYWENQASANLLPPGDHPLITDLGALPNKITLRAFFIDRVSPFTRPNDPTPVPGIVSYTYDRDRFLKLVNDPNPYMLQLPTYEPFPAVPGNVKASYDNNTWGIEYVDVDFYRATTDIVIPKNKGSNALVQDNTDELFEAIVKNAIGVMGTVLLDVLRNGLLPTNVSTALEASNTSALEKLISKIKSTTSTVISSVQTYKATVDTLVRKATAISNKISSLVLTPSTLADEILAVYTELADAITDPIESFNYMKNRLVIFLDDMKNVTYDTLDALGLYDSAINIQHISSCFSNMSSSILDYPFASAEDALQTIDDVTELYDDIISVLAKFPEYSDTYVEMQKLYGSVVDYVLKQQALLPNTRTINVPENTPLLVTAYNIYGDARYVDTIAYRNSVDSAIFPPTTLEVLIA